MEITWRIVIDISERKQWICQQECWFLSSKRVIFDCAWEHAAASCLKVTAVYGVRSKSTAFEFILPYQLRQKRTIVFLHTWMQEEGGEDFYKFQRSTKSSSGVMVVWHFHPGDPCFVSCLKSLILPIMRKHHSAPVGYRKLHFYSFIYDDMLLPACWPYLLQT